MSFVPSGSIAAAFAPLRAVFGSRLTMERVGSAVRWRVDGLETIVEPKGLESVCVTFVESRMRDAIVDDSVAPLYEAATEYRLTSDGAKRLADDMFAFFGGMREPRFRFFGFRESAFVLS